ncbi:hypothetical protein M3936_08150 [Sutcliffiella horikoshii]|uniref:hypothetical protein n=1 Tax=Sutcliffiella horikoshii TaxID=79883 RepID=UPI0020417E92|nr:hypothetical protein [Sutcliffiella horikoshii]MCM3617549.1 hypothetical protein [Sutcliffiella horikoshii]
MFTDLNQELLEVKDNLRKKAKYEEHIERLNTYLSEEKRKKYQLESLLEKEEEDVARLERFTLTSVFYSMIGKKMEKLDQEQKEVLAAKLKYTEVIETIEDVERELSEFRTLLAPIADAPIRYQTIIREKEKLIKDSNSIWSEKLYDLADKEADLQTNLNEYNEAIGAGELAVGALERALSSLDSAKGWSTFDMFGGGMVSTAMKHSRLDDAKKHIHQAQNKLRVFQDELLDIKHHFDSTIEVGGMLTFADYFFDGLIVDWMVHGKITQSYDQTSQIIGRVSRLLGSLIDQRGQMEEELLSVKEEKKNLLESSS